MPIDDGDAACLAALAQELGHGAPFADEELAQVTSLTVTHARDLEALGQCTALTHLRVIASEVESFDFCEPLEELAHLELLASRVGSFSGTAFCPKLARVDLLYTSVSEAGDLFGIGAFRRGTLIGNPWTDRSWAYLHEERDSKLMELPAEHDWKLTRQLWDGRAEEEQACCGPVAESVHLLVRPGLPRLTANVFDALSLHASVIRHERNVGGGDVKLAQLFREYASQIVAPDLSYLSALAQLRELGGGDEVEGWIAAAALDDDDKAALRQLVQRFPDVPFVRASEALIERESAGLSVALPGWYREQRKTLDGWVPGNPQTFVRFDGFDFSTPYGGRAAKERFWLGLTPHGSEQEAAMLAAGFVAVGSSIDDSQTMLAMQVGGDERRVYIYVHEDVSDAISEGRDVSTSIYPAFRSYASMLGHIASLHPQGEADLAAR
jgi:hypothetical protein